MIRSTPSPKSWFRQSPHNLCPSRKSHSKVPGSLVQRAAYRTLHGPDHRSSHRPPCHQEIADPRSRIWNATISQISTTESARHSLVTFAFELFRQVVNQMCGSCLSDTTCQHWWDYQPRLFVPSVDEGLGHLLGQLREGLDCRLRGFVCGEDVGVRIFNEFGYGTLKSAGLWEAACSS